MGDEHQTRSSESVEHGSTVQGTAPEAWVTSPQLATPAVGVGRVLVQAKLSVGPAGDRYEQEADAVAARVVRSLSAGIFDSPPDVADRDDGRVVRSRWVGATPETVARRIGRIQRSTTIGLARGAIDADTESRIQRSAMVGLAGGAIDADTESRIQSSRGGGKAMPNEARSKMEGAFGADFSGVRVHEGSEATELNDRIQAKAFTVGSDVYFRDGMPDTSSSGGQELLAHELSHVVQQSGSVNRKELIQRKLMTQTLFYERAGDDVPKLAHSTEFSALLMALSRFDRIRLEAKSLHEANQEEFNTQSQMVLKSARECLALLAQSIEALEGTLGVRTGSEQFVTAQRYPQARSALVELKRQLYDEAMLEIIDIALEVEQKFNLVQSENVPGAEELVGNRHSRAEGGNLRDLKKLGAGAMNSVFLMETIDTEEKVVFKGDQRAEMPALNQAGSSVNEGGAAYSNRAVAMYRLDQLLGFDVIPKTEFAERNGVFGSIMSLASGKSPLQEIALPLDKAAEVKEGTSKTVEENLKLYQNAAKNAYQGAWDVNVNRPGDRAPALDARTEIGSGYRNFMKNGDQVFRIEHGFYNFKFADAQIQEGLTSLQLVDLIAGQVDRHPGNYFIGYDKARGRVRVIAIDNDAAFGAEHTDLKNQNIPAGKLTRLPDVVSKNQAEKIERVTEEQVATAMEGLLPQNEIDATLARFRQVKQHLVQMREAGQLVDEFDPSTYRKLLAAPREGNVEGSYVGRDAKKQAELAVRSKESLILDAKMDVDTKDLPSTENPERAAKPLPLPPVD